MRRRGFRGFQQWIVLCLICMGTIGLLANTKEQPEIYYYLAVPSCPQKGECLFVACIQLDRQGIPVDAKGNIQKGSQPFFSIWRSGYWEEKEPGRFVKNEGDWKSDIHLQAERAVAKNADLTLLPAPLREFFLEIEKFRCSSLHQQIIVQPLFKAGGFVGWEHVKHLDVLATASTVSPEERSKAFIVSLREAKETDPAKGLEAVLAKIGTKPRSLHYWPEYNLLLIEADAEFKNTIELLFSPL